MDARDVAAAPLALYLLLHRGHITHDFVARRERLLQRQCGDALQRDPWFAVAFLPDGEGFLPRRPRQLLLEYLDIVVGPPDVLESLRGECGRGRAAHRRRFERL